MILWLVNGWWPATYGAGGDRTPHVHLGWPRPPPSVWVVALHQFLSFLLLLIFLFSLSFSFYYCYYFFKKIHHVGCFSNFNSIQIKIYIYCHQTK
jgi:hypothetical protein